MTSAAHASTVWNVILAKVIKKDVDTWTTSTLTHFVLMGYVILSNATFSSIGA